MRPILLCLLVAAPLTAGDTDESGPDVADVAKQLRSKDSNEVIAAARTAATIQDAKVLSPLIHLLRDKNPAVRTAAIEALALRTEAKQKKGAAQALAARLGPLSTKEEDRAELLAVIKAMHDLAQPATIKALLDIKSGTDREVARARAMAVGNVPSKEAIERLIQFGYKDRRGTDATRRVATEALAYATQERVKGGVEQWRQWWSENEKTFDPVAAAEKRKETRAKAEEKQARREARRNRQKNKGD
jgi:HEAT repeat protein